MYSIETIQKVVRALNTRKAELDAMPVEQIRLCISAGNRKIGRVMNVSLPPVLSCANCKECMHLCYDIKACVQYANTVIDARMRNYSVLLRDRDGFFARIDAAITRRRKNKFFRWHVAGDILDTDYFDRMVKIAREHADFVFWTYTKNYSAVNAWVAEHGKDAIPANFSVMFSEWRGMPMENPYGFAEFKVVFKDEKKPVGFYCPGNCDICKEKMRGCLVQETVYCNEH